MTCPYSIAAGYGGMTFDKCAPRVFRPDADPDAPAPRNGRRGQPAIFDEQAIAEQIELVLGERDAHGHREIPGPAAEMVRVQTRRVGLAAPLHRAGTAPPHHGNALHRL